MFDFFDAGMMEGLAWRLSRCTRWRLGGACPLREPPGRHTLTLHAALKATRYNALEARVEALLTYFPPHVWVTFDLLCWLVCSLLRELSRRMAAHKALKRCALGFWGSAIYSMCKWLLIWLDLLLCGCLLKSSGADFTKYAQCRRQHASLRRSGLRLRPFLPPHVWVITYVYLWPRELLLVAILLTLNAALEAIKYKLWMPGLMLLIYSPSRVTGCVNLLLWRCPLWELMCSPMNEWMNIFISIPHSCISVGTPCVQLFRGAQAVNGWTIVTCLHPQLTYKYDNYVKLCY